MARKKKTTEEELPRSAEDILAESGIGSDGSALPKSGSSSGTTKRRRKGYTAADILAESNITPDGGNLSFGGRKPNAQPRNAYMEAFESAAHTPPQYNLMDIEKYIPPTNPALNPAAAQPQEQDEKSGTGGAVGKAMDTMMDIGDAPKIAEPMPTAPKTLEPTAQNAYLDAFHAAQGNAPAANAPAAKTPAGEQEADTSREAAQIQADIASDEEAAITAEEQRVKDLNHEIGEMYRHKEDYSAAEIRAKLRELHEAEVALAGVDTAWIDEAYAASDNGQYDMASLREELDKVKAQLAQYDAKKKKAAADEDSQELGRLAQLTKPLEDKRNELQKKIDEFKPSTRLADVQSDYLNGECEKLGESIEAKYGELAALMGVEVKELDRIFFDGSIDSYIKTPEDYIKFLQIENGISSDYETLKKYSTVLGNDSETFLGSQVRALEAAFHGVKGQAEGFLGWLQETDSKIHGFFGGEEAGKEYAENAARLYAQAKIDLEDQQKAMQRGLQNAGMIQSTAFKAAENIAELVPEMAISTILQPVIGAEMAGEFALDLMFMRVYGGSNAEMLDGIDAYDQNGNVIAHQDMSYFARSMMSGVEALTEYATEKMFGMIGNKVYGESVAGKELFDVWQDKLVAKIKNVTKRPAAAAAMSLGFAFLGEASEEAVSGALAPMTDMVFLDTDVFKAKYGLSEDSGWFADLLKAEWNSKGEIGEGSLMGGIVGMLLSPLGMRGTYQGQQYTEVARGINNYDEYFSGKTPLSQLINEDARAMLTKMGITEDAQIDLMGVQVMGELLERAKDLGVEVNLTQAQEDILRSNEVFDKEHEEFVEEVKAENAAETAAEEAPMQSAEEPVQGIQLPPLFEEENAIEEEAPAEGTEAEEAVPAEEAPAEEVIPEEEPIQSAAEQFAEDNAIEEAPAEEATEEEGTFPTEEAPAEEEALAKEPEAEEAPAEEETEEEPKKGKRFGTAQGLMDIVEGGSPTYMHDAQRSMKSMQTEELRSAYEDMRGKSETNSEQWLEAAILRNLSDRGETVVDASMAEQSLDGRGTFFKDDYWKMFPDTPAAKAYFAEKGKQESKAPAKKEAGKKKAAAAETPVKSAAEQFAENNAVEGKNAGQEQRIADMSAYDLDSMIQDELGENGGNFRNYSIRYGGNGNRTTVYVRNNDTGETKQKTVKPMFRTKAAAELILKHERTENEETTGENHGGRSERLLTLDDRKRTEGLSERESQRETAQFRSEYADQQGDYEETSAADLIGYGSERKVRVIPERDYDPQMKQADREAYERFGIHPTYVLGPIVVQEKTAEQPEIKASAWFGDDRIIVNAAHPSLSVLQLGDHEGYHSIAPTGGKLETDTMDLIRSRIGSRRMNAIEKRYAQAYAWVIDPKNGSVIDAEGNVTTKARAYVANEIAADFYAGITNRFAEVRLDADVCDEVRKFVDSYQENRQTERPKQGKETAGEKAAKEQQRTGPPDGPTELKTENGRSAGIVDGGQGRFSLSTYEEEGGGRDQLKAYLDERVAEKKVTKKEAKQIMQQMEAYYDLCQKYRKKYSTFSKWSDAKIKVDPNTGLPVFSVVKQNAEYKMNLDFSLICKKRRTLDAVFNEMIKMGIMDDFEMKEGSIAAINDIIRQYDFETACALCFVDTKRYRQALVADDYVGMYNELVRSMMKDGQHADYFNFGGDSRYAPTQDGINTLDDSELDFKVIDEILSHPENKLTVEYKIAKDLKDHPEDRQLLLRGDFMSSAGFDEVRVKNNRVLSMYNSKKGAGGPKAAQSDVQYLNDIQHNKDFDREGAYSVGGVRIQSFSDYVSRLVFDYMQMFGDLAASKLPAHAYTKEALYALQFGLTGAKCNMSLVPEIIPGAKVPGLDADGNYAWKDGQSFGSTVYGGNPKFVQHCLELIGVKYEGQTRLTAQQGYELAKVIQNTEGYTLNCGTIAVGVSDQHIDKMLDDPNIRMIIPYHASSLNHIVAVMTNIEAYTDYTDVQNTRYMKEDGTPGTKLSKADNTFNFNDELQRFGGDGRAAADAYLKWCDEHGYIPKFDDFADHPNYYKLLADFSCYDMNGRPAQQGDVSLTMPGTDSPLGSLSELVEMGLEEDALLQAEQDEKVPQIIDAIKKTLPTLEQTMDTRTDALTRAEKGVESAEKSIATAEKKVKAAQDALARAEQELEADPTKKNATRVNNKAASLEKAKERLKQARKNLEAKREALNEAKADMMTPEVRGRFSLDDTVVKAAENLEAETDEEKDNVRVIIDYADEAACEKTLNDAFAEIENNGRIPVIGKDIFEKYKSSDTNWDDIKSARKFISNLLKTFSTDTIMFVRNGKRVDAYITADGRNHSTGWNNNPLKATTVEKLKGIAATASYVYSTENDEHAANSIKQPVAMWDHFASVVDVDVSDEGDYIRTYIEFTLRDIDADTREQIYKMEIKKEMHDRHGSGEQENSSDATPNYTDLTSRNDSTTDGDDSQQRNEKNGRLSIDEERYLSDTEQKAIDIFGTTENFEEAGYILSNGEMLRFTSDSKSGQRDYDHRAIAKAYGQDIDLNKNHGHDMYASPYLNRFVEEGAIRLDTGDLDLDMDMGIQLSSKVPLTANQEETIRKLLEWKQEREENHRAPEEFGGWSLYDGPLTLHIEFGGDADYAAGGVNAKDLAAWGIEGLHYEGKIYPRKVIQDIREYYRTGKAPQQSSLAQFRYSVDEEYTELAQEPEKNEAKLQEMVEQAAREAGYDSPVLYHGTASAFGFTVFDPSKSDDGISLFFTDSENVAGTYTSEWEGVKSKRRISEAQAQNYEYDRNDPKAIAKAAKDVLGEDIVLIPDKSAKGGYRFEFSDGEATNAFALNTAINEALHSGIYSVYANTSDFFELDAKGANWDNIRITNEMFEEVNEITDEFITHNWDTRQISEYAKYNEYPGVIIRNVVDTDDGSNTPSTIYIVYDSNQIKSADPVTYDDNGEVIPLSERFNEENDDIRYSIDEERSEDTTEGMPGAELSWWENYRQNAITPNEREDFRGTEHLAALGINIAGNEGVYAHIDMLKNSIRAARSAKRAIEAEEKRLKPSKAEKEFARGIADGTYTEEDIPSTLSARKIKDLSEFYIAAENTGDKAMKKQRRLVDDKLDQKMSTLMSDVKTVKRPQSLTMNFRTPLRSMRTIFGDKVGNEIFNAVFAPVEQNTAERDRFRQRMYDAVAEFECEDGKKRRLSKQESAVVMSIIENEQANIFVKEMETSSDSVDKRQAKIIRDAVEALKQGKPIKDILKEYKGDAKVEKTIRQLQRWDESQQLIKDKKLDTVKLDNAAKTYAAQFAMFYDAINDLLAAHGYAPIGFIKGYAPHMQEEHVQTALQKALASFGITEDVTSLPTEIAGMTASFRPNKRWNPYFLNRNGENAKQDIVDAYESYVDYMSDVIYHMDDIMRVRAFERYFREAYSSDNIRDKIDEAKEAREGSLETKLKFLRDVDKLGPNDTLTEDSADEKIYQYMGELYNMFQENSTHGALVTWLTDYANNLAAKQLSYDRGMEYLVGRKTLNLANKLTRTFATSQVGAKLSSVFNQGAQLPQIYAELGGKYTLRALKDFAFGGLRKGGWAEQSDFLTTKRGVESVAPDLTDMIVTKMFAGAEFVDSMMSTLAVRGKYLQALDKGMTPKQAMKAADRFGSDIMGSRAKGTKPLAFESKSPIMRMFTMFQIEALNSWDHMITDLPHDFRQIEAKHGRAAAASALAGVIIKALLAAFTLNRLDDELYGGTPAPFDILGLTANFVASGNGLRTNDLMAELINRMWRKAFDEDLFDPVENGNRIGDGQFAWQNAAGDLGENILNDVPLLKNLTSLLGWGDSSLPFAGAGIGDMVKKAVGSEDVYKSWPDLIRQFLLGFVPGGSQIDRTYQGARAILDGGVYTAGGKKKYGFEGLESDDPLEQALTAARLLAFGKYANPEAQRYFAEYDYQKAMQNAGMGGNKQTAYAFATEAGMKSGDAEKMVKSLWNEAKSASVDKDGKPTDSINQAGAKAALDAANIPNDLKAVLWQCFNKSWKSKNNPYSTTIGEEVYRYFEYGDDFDVGGLSLPGLG